MDLTGLALPAGFFRAFALAGVDPWMAQRAWWVLLLVMAWGGAVVLLGRLRVGSVAVTYAAALVYSLSPALLGSLSGVSPDLAAAAALPWALAGVLAGRPRAALTTTGLAVAFAGAAPGPGSITVLVVVVVFATSRLVTGPARRSASLALLGGLLGSAWWLVPVMLQHRTGPSSPQDVDPVAGQPLRSVLELLVTLGTGPWHAGSAVGWLVLLVVGVLGCVVARRRALGPLTIMLVGSCVVVAASWLVDAAQLSDVSVAHRATALYTAALPGDAVVRLGLVGMAALAADWAWRNKAASRWQPGLLGVIVIGAGLALLPAVSDRLVDLTVQDPPPAAWAELSARIDAEGGGRVLVLPSALPRSATWLAPLESPLAVAGQDDVADVHGVGGQRAVAVESLSEHLGAGDGSPSVRAVLEGAGIRWVVVRRDLAPDLRRPPLALVRAGLLAAGVQPVDGFGPLVDAFGVEGRPLVGDDRSVDFGTATAGPLLELWEVTWLPETPVPGRAAAQDAVAVTGGAAAAAAVADAGVSSHSVAATVPVSVTTDAERDRDRFVDLALPNHGATVATRPRAELTTGTSKGVDSVVASSSASDPQPGVPTRPADQPIAAVDGNDFTAWRSADGDVVGAWWSVRSSEPLPVGDLRVSWIDDRFVGPPVETVLVTTDFGKQVLDVPPGGGLTIPLTERTSGLRLDVLVVGKGKGGVGIAEVVPASGRRLLRLPPGDVTGPVVLSAAPESSRPCVADATGFVACSPGLLRAGEDVGGIDRLLSAQGTYRLSATAVSLPGAALDALIDLAAPPGTPTAKASSSLVSDPRGAALAAIDGDPGTTWTAGLTDSGPVLTIAWPEQHEVRTVSLDTSLRAAVSRATKVRIGWDSGSVVRSLGPDSVVNLGTRGVETTTLRIEILASEDREGVDSATAGVRLLPAGITEVLVNGDAVRSVDPDRSASLPCGSGPSVTMDGLRVQTRVVATYDGLVTGTPSSVVACAAVILRPGVQHRLSFDDGYVWSPRTLALTPEGIQVARIQVVAQIDTASPGWRSEDPKATAVLVDGWRQGWVTESNERVVVSWWPTQWLRWGSTGGLAGFSVVLGLTWLVQYRNRSRRRRAGQARVAGGGEPL